MGRALCLRDASLASARLAPLACASDVCVTCACATSSGLQRAVAPPLPRPGRLGMIHFVLLISRQGKVRLTKWYSPYSAKEKSRAVREVSAVVLSRQQKQCNFLEYKDKKIIYKR